jgi:hypothetical protein
VQHTIEVPVDVYPITLSIPTSEIRERTVTQGSKGAHIQRERVEGQPELVEPGVSQAVMQKALDDANVIWSSAGIKFTLANWTPRTTRAPADKSAVDDSGFGQLVKELKISPRRVSVLVTAKFDAGTNDVGRTDEKAGACIVPRLGAGRLAKTLAHELGHILGLPDVPRVPGSVTEYSRLMYEREAGDETQLNSEEIKIARSKAVAKSH